MSKISSVAHGAPGVPFGKLFLGTHMHLELQRYQDLKRGWPDRCLPLTACERRWKRSPKPAGRREVGWQGDQDKLLQWGKEETPVQWGDCAGRSSSEQFCTPTATGRDKDPEELMCSVSFSSGAGKLSLQRAG